MKIQHEPAFDLRAWRTERLGRMKQTAEYRSLSPVLRQVVDHLVRRHESPDEGITVGQEKLAKRFTVTRETMNRYLSAITEAGVLTRERRGRKGEFGVRGRTTNRYRLNELLLTQQATINVIAAHSNAHINPHSGSTSSEVHLEGSLYRENHIEETLIDRPGGRVYANDEVGVSQENLTTSLASPFASNTFAPSVVSTVELRGTCRGCGRDRQVEKWRCEDLEALVCSGCKVISCNPDTGYIEFETAHSEPEPVAPSTKRQW